MTRLKVGLVYQDALAEGGYPRDVRALAVALRDIGCDVTLFTDRPKHTERAELAEDIRVSSFGSLLRSRARLDLIHVLGLFLPRHLAVLARHAAGSTPVVLSPLSHLQSLAVSNNKAQKRSAMAALAPILRSLAAVHVFSETERNSLRQWRGLQEAPSFIASLGIHDTADLSTPTDHGAPATIAFFGRNDVHQKGIDLAIQAFSRYAREIDGPGGGPHLVIAGRSHGSSTARIRELVRVENVGSRVDILGSVADEEKWQLLRKATILIFMSRFDGPPRPIREALSVGTPCLVSYESNMGELVEKFGAGRAVLLEPAAIARCLHEAFRTPRTLDSWRAGALRLRAELAWPNVARMYLSGYESVGVTSTPARRSPTEP